MPFALPCDTSMVPRLAKLTHYAGAHHPTNKPRAAALPSPSRPAPRCYVLLLPAAMAVAAGRRAAAQLPSWRQKPRQLLHTARTLFAREASRCFALVLPRPLFCHTCLLPTGALRRAARFASPRARLLNTRRAPRGAARLSTGLRTRPANAGGLLTAPVPTASQGPRLLGSSLLPVMPVLTHGRARACVRACVRDRVRGPLACVPLTMRDQQLLGGRMLGATTHFCRMGYVWGPRLGPPPPLFPEGSGGPRHTLGFIPGGGVQRLSHQGDTVTGGRPPQHKHCGRPPMPGCARMAARSVTEFGCHPNACNNPSAGSLLAWRLAALSYVARGSLRSQRR